MKINIELDENEVRALVLAHLAERLGDVPLEKNDVVIEVKTKSNYRTAEWEPGLYRARVSKVV